MKREPPLFRQRVGHRQAFQHKHVVNLVLPKTAAVLDVRFQVQFWFRNNGRRFQEMGLPISGKLVS